MKLLSIVVAMLFTVPAFASTFTCTIKTKGYSCESSDEKCRTPIFKKNLEEKVTTMSVSAMRTCYMDAQNTWKKFKFYSDANVHFTKVSFVYENEDSTVQVKGVLK